MVGGFLSYRHITDMCIRIDEGEVSLVGTFQNAIGRDKDRCTAMKGLYIRSVGML